MNEKAAESVEEIDEAQQAPSEGGDAGGAQGADLVTADTLERAPADDEEASLAVGGELVPVEAPAATIFGPRPSELGVVEHMVDSFTALGPEVIHTEGSFYVWSGTHWRRADKRETVDWVRPYDGAAIGKRVLALTLSKIESILRLLAIELAAPGFFDDRPVGINARDGFVDLGGGRAVLRPHHPSQRQDFVLAGSWLAEGAPDQHLRTLIRGCFADAPDAGRRAVLLTEIAGAVAAGIGTKLRDPAAFVFVGDGANGKSQILDVLQGLVPPDAVSTIPITDFGHDRYRIKLAGKRLNLCAELGVGRAIASDKFKAIVSGDVVSARDIREPVASFRPRAVHVFATNVLPPFDAGMPMSISRRLVVVPFTRMIPKAERIGGIGQFIVQTETDALVSYAVRGAVRLLRSGRYTVPSASRAAMREWVEEADVVEAFLADGWVRPAQGVSFSTADVYAHFEAFAATQRMRKLPSVKELVRRMVTAGKGYAKKRTASKRYIDNIMLVGFPALVSQVRNR